MADAVYVINHNEKDHFDMLDGQTYGFLSEQYTFVPVKVAKHCFGYEGNDEDKRICCQRMGKDYPAGLDWLNKFEIKTEMVEDQKPEAVRTKPEVPKGIKTGKVSK